MPIYTKTGDNGETSLADGTRVRKCCCRIDAYGTVDELSSFIGLLIAKLSASNRPEINAIVKDLLTIQNNLFNIGSELAGATVAGSNLSAVTLEKRIDDMNGSLPALHEFILPGGTEAAATAHVCRTVCRRAERCITALADTEKVPHNIITYINRLSDYLFVLAKRINFLAELKENTWQKTCK